MNRRTQVLRMVITIVCGYLAYGLVVVIGAAILLLTLVHDRHTISPAYLIGYAIVSFVAALVGGALTGFIVRRRVFVHVAGLGLAILLVDLLSVANAARVPGATPLWYGIALAVLGTLGALAGGSLVESARSISADAR